MKILFSCALSFFVTIFAKSQIKYYNTIEKNDSSAIFHYCKKIDMPIKEKLDSFFNFIKSTNEYKKNKGYIQVDLFKNSTGKNVLDFSVNSTYASYRIFTSKKNYFGNVFAFSFYKSHLILFTASYSKHRIKEEFVPLLNDLIYPELTFNVKKEIDKKTEDFEIEPNSLIKRYFW